jgi:hypothetical protein
MRLFAGHETLLAAHAPVGDQVDLFHC